MITIEFPFLASQNLQKATAMWMILAAGVFFMLLAIALVAYDSESNSAIYMRNVETAAGGKMCYQKEERIGRVPIRYQTCE